MSNHWKWQAKDKEGKVVEAAPGLKTFDSRGPGSKSEMIKEGQKMLNNMRIVAMNEELANRESEWKNLSGLELLNKRREIATAADPGYKVDHDSVIELEDAGSQFDEEGNLTDFVVGVEHAPVALDRLMTASGGHRLDQPGDQ